MTSQQRMSPDDFIRTVPPGGAIYSERHVVGEASSQIAILLREESRRIQAIPINLGIGSKAGLIAQGDVLVAVTLLSVDQGDYGKELFELWWNYHQPEDTGVTAFHLMASQPVLRLWWYGDTGAVERVIQIENPWVAFFRFAEQRIRHVPTWSMAEFDSAREVIEGEYPSILALWEEFKEKESVLCVN